MHYRWTEDLTTGHPVIDAQHRRILSEVGTLSEALKEHRGKEQGPETFRFLTGYIRDHFTQEEQLMEGARYPGLAEHAAQHAQIAERLGGLEATLRGEGPTANFLLLLNRMCLDWLFTHILTKDRDMALFLRGGAQLSPSGAPEPPRHPLKKILVVEDSDLIRRMYDMILARYRREGVEILHASNGSEALDLLGRHPDTTLVITDRNMPVMDGVEFIRRCQKNKALSSIPILVASTLDQADGIREAIQAGARGYLTKPFDQDQLYVLIGRLFDEAGPPGLGGAPA